MKNRKNIKSQRILSDKEQFIKQASSPNYRKAIKRFVQQVKILRGLDRIPNLGERPKKVGIAQDRYDKKASVTPTKKCIHFWMTTIQVDDIRRMRFDNSDDTEVNSKNNSTPKNSLKY